jgi:hypothetical protein
MISRIAGLALLGIVGWGGEALSQAVVDVPAVRTMPSRDSLVLELLEAPSDIAFGTMAVNVWATVVRTGSVDPITEVTLVWPREDGEERIEMRPVDGALDSVREQVVATVDTYAWTQTGAHEFEVHVGGETGPTTKIGGGSVNVKTRISTPDLFLFDEGGVAHPWIGSGAGGFTPAGVLTTGPPARPLIADVNGDRLPDLVLSVGFGEVAFYYNQGAGRFDSGHSISTEGDVVATAIGDLDADDRLDLVTVSSDGALDIRLDLADEPTQRSTLTLAPELLELADLDGDGFPEIFVALLGLDTGEVHVWTRLEAETASWAPSVRLVAAGANRARIRGLARAGPAGPLWILSSSPGEATLESWGGPADTRPGSEPVLSSMVSVPGEPIALVPGRFGREGSVTCLVAVRGEATTVYELRGQELVPRLEIAGSDPAALAALDLDGDGDDDLVTGGDELRVWINLRDGDFREAGESPYLLDSPVSIVVAGNLDERGP